MRARPCGRRHGIPSSRLPSWGVNPQAPHQPASRGHAPGRRPPHPCPDPALRAPRPRPTPASAHGADASAAGPGAGPAPHAHGHCGPRLPDAGREASGVVGPGPTLGDGARSPRPRRGRGGPQLEAGAAGEPRDPTARQMLEAPEGGRGPEVAAGQPRPSAPRPPEQRLTRPRLAQPPQALSPPRFRMGILRLRRWTAPSILSLATRRGGPPVTAARSGVGNTRVGGGRTGREGSPPPGPPWPQQLAGSHLLPLALRVPSRPRRPRKDLPSTATPPRKDAAGQRGAICCRARRPRGVQVSLCVSRPPAHEPAQGSAGGPGVRAFGPQGESGGALASTGLWLELGAGPPDRLLPAPSPPRASPPARTAAPQPPPLDQELWPGALERPRP